MSEPFIGEIILFAGNFAPRNWAFCQGQLLSIAQNTALFSILGTQYGGDGRTNFGLPDLRGRAVVGVGQGPGLSRYLEGQAGGVEEVTLGSNQIPSHNHGVTHTASFGAQTGNADLHEPAPDRALGIPTIQGNAGLNIYSSQPPDTDIEAGMSGNLVLDNAGGSQSHNNVQPFLAMNYIIALVGIFPSRN